jgi:hypothetical protein
VWCYLSSLAVIKLVAQLLDFGFYATQEGIAELVQAMCKALDGRLDVVTDPELDVTSSGDGVRQSDWNAKQQDWVVGERYTVDDRNKLLMDIKAGQMNAWRRTCCFPHVTKAFSNSCVGTEMCRVMKRIDDCRMSFRLSSMVNTFKLGLRNMDNNPDAMRKQLYISRREDEATNEIEVMAFDDERKRGAGRWTTSKAFRKTQEELFSGKVGTQLDMRVLLPPELKCDTRAMILDLLMYVCVRNSPCFVQICFVV